MWRQAEPASVLLSFQLLIATSFGLRAQTPATHTAASNNAATPRNQSIEDLSVIVAELKSQVSYLYERNIALEERIERLERCECRASSCLYKGVTKLSGEKFHEDNCTACLCQDGQVTCNVNQSLPECQDFCKPNSCLNGGICRPSRWPAAAPERVRCLCLPGFEGPRCERVASFVCGLPRQTGECGNFSQRWHYNELNRRCEPFAYSGCAGNANNFATFEECRKSCVMGSCCYRLIHQQPTTNQTYGFSRGGYDKYGYSANGYDSQGRRIVLSLDTVSFDHQYRFSGYDWQGFDASGFNSDGIDRQGYDRHGYHVQTGYNRQGFNRMRIYDGKLNYDKAGLDSSGYARDGYSCAGVDENGYDASGLFVALDYKCDYMTVDQCRLLETDRPTLEVIRFSHGKQCSESCRYADRRDGRCTCVPRSELFSPVRPATQRAGCDTLCRCSAPGFSPVARCFGKNATTIRKEVRDMEADELSLYQTAIARLNAKPIDGSVGSGPSAWQAAALARASHAPHAHRRHFLPWHRRFLAEMELALQEIAGDSSLYIPYFDWTIDSSDLAKSTVWRANIFGGTGEASTGCVRHNPFSSRLKGSIPQEWSPCLMRHFDRSIVMPNPVVMESVLREPTLEAFEAKLQSISSLFHSFVGGHMATTLAAFDPVFLSHYAFLDKLWSDWQSRNRFKQVDTGGGASERYKPMEPFGVSVNSVLLSAEQLCVTYLPLASRCRSSYGDRQPLILKNNQFFDVDGFDTDGYDKNGFDVMGYNRQGYYIDGFNADGYDSLGYDRKGYDRHGFTLDGWSVTGVHRNGSYITQVLSALDAHGFSRFGLNRHGVDVYGRDASGYDAAGNDVLGCNAYFGWGEHIKQKRRLELELQAMPADELERLTRTCTEPVSEPRSWFFELCWLPKPGRLCWLPAFRQAARPPASEQSSDTWRPQDHGARYCVAISWIAGCRIGETPEDSASCGADLCSGARCVGHSTATCWVANCGDVCRRRWTYRGQVITTQCLGCLDEAGIERAEGSRWQPLGKDCEVCTCESGIVYCSNMTCPVPGCSHPVLPADRHESNSTHCCPMCRGCQVGDVVYSNGATFAHPSEPCRECRCRWGNVTCGAEQAKCPSLLGCRPDAVTRPMGSCCPVCTDCGSRRDGERWRNDSCVECICQQGRTVCRRLKCDKDCTHPVLASGECCPKCTDCLYKGSIYRDGGIFQLSETCEQCQCYEGNVRCDELPCPPMRCQRPIKAERGQCCPRCPDGCEYRSKAYSNGTRFIPDHNHCLECVCLSDGSVKCGRLTCPDVSHLPCQRPAVLPGQCCPSFCPKCHYLGQDYEHGDRWLPVGRPCEVCICYEGELSCRSTKACAVSCTHGTYADGECCSPCTDCAFEGSIIADGRSFTRAAGGKCYDCSCGRGTVSCVESSYCPELPCTATETVPGSCCPVCKGCRDEHSGMQRRYGEEWYEASPGQCERVCACIEGIVRCRQKECPALSCRFPEDRPGSCCPVCTECAVEGRIYRSGESFTARLDPCRTCLCENGTASCSLMSCPTVSCANPLRSEGRCCPVCPVGQCKHRGVTLNDGQSMEEGCDVCQCTTGRVNCRRKLCPPVVCSHPKPGACCLECQDCLFSGAIVTHGSSVQQDGDPCSVCTCRRGDMSCSKSRACPSVNCQHPYNDTSTCCPTCHHCLYESVVRKQGENFLPADDVCQTCVCNYGTVNCSPTPCPKLPCSHPTQLQGECCGRCTECLYRGRTIADGGRFVDGCQECHCSAGVTLCRRSQCEPVACSHPVDGDCCPSCTDCLYNSTRVVDGTTFRRPDDECQTCACSAGSVVCSPRACPPATCSHPLLSRCGCAECSGCAYNDRLYTDDEVFYDRENRCSVCHCRRGTVSCQAVGCSQTASCTDPDYDECGCAVCVDCIRDGYRIPNGAEANVTVLSNIDPCTRCRCQDGTVSCSTIECHKPSCTHPGRGRCNCLECNGCNYGGSERGNGESFDDPEDACRTCQCMNGDVTCTTATCNEVVCSHPALRTCCPTCVKCLYNGLTYEDGANFTVDNGCSNCVCEEGSVTCSRKRCIRPSCPFLDRAETTAGGCCESCRGCLVDDIRHAHATTWTKDDCGESCSCHGGVVTCSSIDCVTPCASPIRRPDMHCCPLCPGCSIAGRRYGDGERFQHPSDPCVHCQCRGDNLACMRQPCPSTDGCPKDQLLPPDDRRCCATCLVAFNESCGAATLGLAIRPSSDPCFVCTCIGEQWTCSREHCPLPVSPCEAPGGLVQVPGECCPVCPVCVHNGARYDDGATWTDPDEPCSSCTCQHGRSVCRNKAATCPLFVCGPGTTAIVKPGECCTVCVDANTTPLQPVASSCRESGRIYESGESWRLDECTSCECSAGLTLCTTETCEDPRCASDEVATLLPSICCPQCIKQPATCIAYGDPHYRTFDGDTVHFQGFCRYTMAADCVGRQFSVETEHDHRNTSSVSWVYSVTVRVNGSNEIRLIQGGGVEVGGQPVDLPYLLESLVSVERRSGVTLLNTAVGLKVHWDGSSHVEVKVSGDYKGRMCGLCGNFNNFPQDDMKTRQGTVTASPAVFGNSWRVKGSGSSGSADCQDAADVDPCALAGYHAKRNAATKCSVLMGNQFSKCHRVIPPDAYYSSCTYDLCACYDHQSLKGSSSDCLCEVLSTYASACAQAGVALNWRSASLCSIECDASKGFVFDDCGPPCPRTCANHDRPPGQMEPHCYRPCVPSCQCPAGRVLHDGRCLSPAACATLTTKGNASMATPP